MFVESEALDLDFCVAQRDTRSISPQNAETLKIPILIYAKPAWGNLLLKAVFYGFLEEMYYYPDLLNPYI